MNHFSKGARIMAVGGLISQCIPLIAAPVLTRLYSPESFGLFSSFFAIASILAIPATLRLDLALILPSSEREVVSLASGAMIFSTGLLLVLAALMMLVNSFVMPLESIHVLGPLLTLLPAMSWCIAIQSIMVGVANFRRKYGAISTGGVLQQLVAALLSVFLGIAGFHAGGLIASRMAAFASGAVALNRLGARRFFFGWRETLPGFPNLVRRYRQFPLFNVSYSISGLLARDFPILALTSSGFAATAGQFAIARMAASLPGNFLSSILTNVYYREAAEHLDTVQFTQLTWRLSKALALIVMPPFVLVALWGEDIFRMVFGEHWSEAGRVFGYLALPFALLVWTGWMERVFEVRAKQQLSFVIQIGYDALTVIGVMVVLNTRGDALAAIGFYAAAQTAYQLTYLAAVFVLTGFGWRRYLLILTYLGGLAIVMMTTNFALRLHDWVSPIPRMLVLAATSAVILLLGLRYLVRLFRKMSFDG